MKLSSNKALLVFIVTSCLYAQHYGPSRFLLQSTVQDTFLSQGLQSNIVAEIRLMGDSLTWFGTGRGLALHDGKKIYHHRSNPLGSFNNGEATNFLPEGGIPAIAVMHDTMAVAFSGDNGTIQVGYGIALTYNGQMVVDSSGIDWIYLDQPVDVESDSIKPFGEGFYKTLPVTVSEANVTYDAYLNKDYLWTASWAGGLRRYDLNSRIWESVPLPMDHQDSLDFCNGFDTIDDYGRPMISGYYLNPRDPANGGNHNHKAFSVLVDGDTVWVGTANGLNRGVMINEWDGAQLYNCINWNHFSYNSNPDYSVLTGNFVVGIAKQVWNGNTTIWAATKIADSQGEMNGLSYTRDGGTSWNTTLLGEKVYNITARDSLIFASSESGLWKSFDGNNWALFNSAIDTTFMSTGEVLSEIVYASELDERFGIPKLWIGTNDGIALSADLNGSNWTIFQTEYDSTEFYAYPNPFSPIYHNQKSGEGYVRFHTGSIFNTSVELDVYNFAMEKVYQKKFDLNSYDGVLKWNGRDLNGDFVHNGVYFIRLRYAPSSGMSPQYFWDKLIVVK